MPYEIIRQDITRMKVDAIVNPTDYLYSGSGGTDARIVGQECACGLAAADGTAVLARHIV